MLTNEGRTRLEQLVKIYATGPLGLRDAIIEGLSALDEKREMSPKLRAVLAEHLGGWFGSSHHLRELLRDIDAAGR